MRSGTGRSAPGESPEGRGGSGRATRGGFTLVEVLVSMVIVAVGLLGLQALGVVAARGLAVAEWRGAHATLAGDSLASALHQLRRGSMPSQFCTEGPRQGERFARTVDLSDAHLARVAVRIEPDPAAPGQSVETFTVRSSIFLPESWSGDSPEAACG